MHPSRLRGARLHNLQDLNLDLEPGSYIAVTGPSGAGKSSLVLDTLYAEGQRRFVESFSPYARQFLERLPRPAMDSLDPVAPAVAIERKSQVKSSRSTLATLADLEPYLSALFAKEAVPFCAKCQVPAIDLDPKRAADLLVQSHNNIDAVFTYELPRVDKEEYLTLREGLAVEGYRRMVLGDAIRNVEEVKPSEAVKTPPRVVTDRLRLETSASSRVREAIEASWKRGAGKATVYQRAEDGTVVELRRVTRGLSCPSCSVVIEPPKADLFSYNSARGACEGCKGFGRMIAVDWSKVIPDDALSIQEGAIKAWGGKSADWERASMIAYCKRKGIRLDVPWNQLAEQDREAVLEGEGGYGRGKFPGVRAWFKWLESKTYKMHVRVFLARYREYVECPQCNGGRLRAGSLNYRVQALTLPAWHKLTVDEAFTRLEKTQTCDPQGALAKDEIAARLRYLHEVGLGYLPLDRQARTLSGGETQRASLTTALSARLTNTLFAIDEPTLGLHALDVPPLVHAMKQLARAGNTVMVVEHDQHVVAEADRVLRLGPGSAKDGGKITFDGNAAAYAKDASVRRAEMKGAVTVRAALARSFLQFAPIRAQNVDVPKLAVPRERLTIVCGPSGSGKSTLVRSGILAQLEAQKASVVVVDQAPLGRTARGNAATYTHAWDRLRKRFESTPDARDRQLTASHFSFNVAAKGNKGRCEACSGEGYETVEMQFLADVQIPCAACNGQRFGDTVLDVRYMGKNIAEILQMTCIEVLDALSDPTDPDWVLKRALEPVIAVGLGYLPIGQPLSTLSGGEAQRLKLARALAEDPTAVFLVDEPSAGLSREDIAYVLTAFRALIEKGATVIAIEHDLDVIKQADHIIELGPGGGPHGGKLVFEGAVDALHLAPTKTGQALRLEAGLAKKESASEGSGAKTTPLQVERLATRPTAAITVQGAREHTLKNVTCAIPHGQVTVVTGPSGSGKSSLAFDVVFAEGQRRFVETLTPYARQFLPTLPRPAVDLVAGVPPSIALPQRVTRTGGNSTVATVTEIAHYLRLLFAKLGETRCTACGAEVVRLTRDEVIARVQGLSGKGTVYATHVYARKGVHLDAFAAASRRGIRTARVDGALVTTDPPPKLAKTKEHTIDWIVDYGKFAQMNPEAIAAALDLGSGALRYAEGDPRCDREGDAILSTSKSCGACGAGVDDLDPRHFSFNTKQGQCATCEGRGVLVEETKRKTDTPEARVCPTCQGERLAPLGRTVRFRGHRYPELCAMSSEDLVNLVRGFKLAERELAVGQAALQELQKRLGFVVEIGLGYLSLARSAESLSGGEMQRLRLSAQLGSGLTGALYVLDEPTIGLHPRDTTRLIASTRKLADLGSTVLIVEHDEEVIRAADHVIDMGPSGGAGGGHVEAQGASAQVLKGTSATATALREKAGTLRLKRRTPQDAPRLQLVGAKVHNLQNADAAFPISAMTVVAGVSGSGKSSLVSQVLLPTLSAAIAARDEQKRATRRASFESAKVPAKKTAKTSVKPRSRNTASTITASTNRAKQASEQQTSGALDAMFTYQDKERLQALRLPSEVRRVIAVDQSPLGRSSRSTPATFLGVWDEIRKLFAMLPDAQVRGFSATRFSFNSTTGGRCTVCEGQGVLVSEMSFLPDVVTRCESCEGLRFEPSTLEVRYREHSIGDVLKLTSTEAAVLFEAHPRIHKPLKMLEELGVGYVQLGQGSHTLSGGEAQRLKLAAELTAGAMHQHTVYVLDEPTTGLHVSDVRRLVTVLDRLVQRGDTLIIVEHHPEVIRSADHVVELGPTGGAKGGKVVFSGTPDELRKAKTATAPYL
jgi:excinuclease ABC subunit A